VAVGTEHVAQLSKLQKANAHGEIEKPKNELPEDQQ
jgi:hypothetical protein